MEAGEQSLSEQQIIRLIGEYLPAQDEHLLVGPGDDAAVLRSSGSDSVLTTDLLVEGVHFDLRYGSLADAGFKALAVNISDVAAMGGVSRHALGNLGVPAGATEGELRELLGGVRDCAAQYGVTLLGGDTVRSPQWIIGFTLLGDLNAKAWTRALARPGDLLYVSGNLGLAQVGLHALCGGLPGFALSRRRQLRPQPRADICELIVQTGIVPACIDLSDSLSKSLLLLAQASQVGLRVHLEAGDFHPELRAFASAMPQSGEAGFVVPGSLDPADKPQAFASLESFLLASAEDYELLLAAPPGLKDHLPQLTVIGEVLEQAQGCKYTDESGRSHELQQSGFEHF